MFKVGDKVRKKDGSKFSNGDLVVTIEKYILGNPWFLETQSHLRESCLELVKEEENMTHDYNEGQWYMWDGKGKCPLHPKDEFITMGLDGSKGGFHDANPKNATQYRAFDAGYWDWNYGINNEVNTGYAVVAFYITKKYKEPETVEMTVEEICKALGKNVKVVK